MLFKLSYTIVDIVRKSSTTMSNIKTFVFVDLETTGLPNLENNKTKITEMAMIAVQEAHLTNGALPRVQNKLSFCFNPRKLISYKSQEMTGLSNVDLEHMPHFSAQTVESINLFLSHNPQPICLVAHNGNRFDFPILRAEVEKTGRKLLEDVTCLDTFLTFKDLHKLETAKIESELIEPSEPIPLELCDGFDDILCQVVDEYENQTKNLSDRVSGIQKVNETTPKKQTIPLNTSSETSTVQNINKCIPIKANVETNVEPIKNKKLKVGKSRQKLNFGSEGTGFKLGDIYKRLTNNEPIDSHKAEGDANMLMICAATYGQKFLGYANQNHKSFSSIPAMTPGKPIPNRY